MYYVIGVHHASNVQKDPLLVSSLFPQHHDVIQGGIPFLRRRIVRLASIPKPRIREGLYPSKRGFRASVSCFLARVTILDLYEYRLSIV
jgi:hypothetical protein